MSRPRNSKNRSSQFPAHILRRISESWTISGFKQVAAEFERTNYAISADLPEMADPKMLIAKMGNGVLTVFIKKRAESQPGAPIRFAKYCTPLSRDEIAKTRIMR